MTGDIRRYSSGSSRWLTPSSRWKVPPKSELHSSDSRLLTARSEHPAAKRSVRPSSQRRHEPAVAAAEHARPGPGRSTATARAWRRARRGGRRRRCRPTRCPARPSARGDRIARAQASSRPEEPWGFAATTANPAPASSWNSSNHFSPYWRHRPAVDGERAAASGSAARAASTSRPSGVTSQASMSPSPAGDGTAKRLRSAPAGRRRRSRP